MPKARPVKLEVAVTRVGASASSGVSMTLKSAKELEVDEVTVLYLLLNNVCDAVIIPKDNQEAPAYVIDKDIEDKPLSQRFRNVLYVYWQQQGSQGDFNDYYRKTMEKLIESYKGRLE